MMKPLSRALWHCCIFVLICTSTTTFPTDSLSLEANSGTTITKEKNELPTSAKTSLQQQQAPGVTVRTTLLPEDRKQFLSYVLGHPTKHSSLKTPSHLMNPDKYEFYAFDDDGKIVKKLMSVQEIQRILANNERGQPHDISNPIEYYQVITISPDVEPPPAISRINPSEPLFSVHDVIASVQNVLKSEIGLKRGQSVTSRPGASSSNINASTTTTTTEAIPSSKTATPATTKAEDSEKPEDQTTVRITTYKSRPQLDYTKTEQDTSTSTSETMTIPEDKIKEKPMEIESVPLSLADAHPGLISNDTFFEPQASVIDQLPQVDFKLEESVGTTQSSTTVANDESETSRPTIPESTISEVQIPINQDLAESVSSVLSQIASEISLGQLDSSILSTEAPLSRINAEDEDNGNKRTESINIDEVYLTTEYPEDTTIPAETTTVNESLVEDNLTQSASNAQQNVVKPQNAPKPFQEVEKEVTKSKPIEEGGTTVAYETTTQALYTDSPIVEDEEIESKLGDFLLDVSSAEETSTSTPVKLISIKPEVLTLSPQNLEPVLEKSTEAPIAKANQTIDGVTVVMEAHVGNIQRPTGTPDEIVKPTERTESITTVEETDSAESRVSNIQIETTINPEPEPSESRTEAQETTTLQIADKNEESKEKKVSAENEEAVKLSTTEKAPEPAEAFKPETRTEGQRPGITDDAELKTLPVNISEMSTQASTQGTTPKQSPVVVVEEEEDVQGSLKQNLPYKPSFSKPQKPVYIKPTRIKTPSEPKPSKPSGGKPTGTREPVETKRPYENHFQSSPSSLELEPAPPENLGLEATSIHLDEDVKQFTELCNELAFSLWSSVTHGGLSFVRSLVVSPFAVTSLLAMVFLGARGPTSGQMNDVLKLDEMVTFNPHLVFRNVTESVVISRNPGVSTAAFVRELYSDKSKGKLLDFYKERAQQFYDGHVEEVNFKAVSETLRRQTNHLVKRQTWGKITDFLKGSNLQLRSPLAAFSANIFQTDCTKASTKDRDGEMYFVILPASRLRRLVPVPAVVWRNNFLAGYEPNLDATVVAISPQDSAVSTIFVLPGQQGLIAPGDTLARLEHHLLGSSYRRNHWTRMMKSLLPRPGLELQIPRLSHRSVINVTSSLQRMGLKDLFNAQKADLTGLNGLANDLHLSDMLQVNLFSICGEDGIGSRHISEVYPATPLLRREKSSDNLFSEPIENQFAVSDFEDPAISALPLELRPRQARIPLSKPGARIPEPPRLRFDRPFLFFVRHNPTGLILHIGRFNPRLST